MNKRFWQLIFVGCLALTLAWPVVAETPLAALPVRLASFNIRAFSDRTRDDGELADIAALIAGFDLVAIQETRDVLILERLVRMLAAEGAGVWQFSHSAKLKSGGGELYAFVWRSDRVQALTEACLVPDPDDHFIREPAWEWFRALGPESGEASLGGFDFVLINYHALFGSSVGKRRLELACLPWAIQEVEQTVHASDPGEQDFMLLGDFNLVCTDRSFDGLRQRGMEATNPGLGTTIADSSYDNIWRFPLATREYTGNWGIEKFDETEFDNNDRRASQAVSDHRPLWAEFSSGPDDD